MPYIKGKYYSQEEVEAVVKERKDDKLDKVITSAAIGAVTGSSIVGGILGGSLTGGILGTL